MTYAAQTTGTGSSAQTITITNIGSQTVALSPVALSGANTGDFVVSGNTCPSALAASSSCMMGVSFAPTAKGTRTAILNIPSSAAGSSNSVPLTGVGQSPLTITFSPRSQNFVPQAVQTSSTTQTVTVTNTGAQGVALTSVVLSVVNASDFAIIGNTCASRTLPPAATCSVELSFTPTGIGNRSAYLNVAGTAHASTKLLAINGTGGLSEQAVWTDQFVDSIGLNTRFAIMDSYYYTQWPFVSQMLIQSGVRHIRDGNSDMPQWYYARINDLYMTDGIRNTP